MEIGMVGLGRMGHKMTHRLLNAGHRVVGYDTNQDTIPHLVKNGMLSVSCLRDMVKAIEAPRSVWVMVPAGDITEKAIISLSHVMSEGDIIIDGGNSNYKDSVRRASELKKRGVGFLDVGTSGGIWGLSEGYCLMIGGEREAFKTLEPIFQALAPAPDRGYGLVGAPGSGHFTKMVHNGIEYGLMQAYAEGFELLDAKTEWGFDLSQISEIWRHGSVIRSWLLDLATSALKDDADLTNLEPYVEDSGEGRWVVQESVELAVPLPVITLALQARFNSRVQNSFGGRLLAALRNKFGGHDVKRPNIP